MRGPRSPRRSRPRSRPRGATAAGAERSPRNPPARPAPPNFRPKGRVRRARCAWRGHNFLSPSEAAGARQLPGRGRTSEGPRPRAHLSPRTRRRAPGPAAALKFPALPLCGGRRRAPSPRSPRRRPGADPRAGPGRATCWKPLASGPLRPPAPAPRPREPPARRGRAGYLEPREPPPSVRTSVPAPRAAPLLHARRAERTGRGDAGTRPLRALDPRPPWGAPAPTPASDLGALLIPAPADVRRVPEGSERGFN